MRRKRIRYNEGDLFAVPLRTGGFAIGLVARKKDTGALGYFFGPRLENPPDLKEVDFKGWSPVLVGVFGDLGLVNGEWPILGSLEGWSESDWPVPLFRKEDLVSGERYAVEYGDNFVIPIKAYRLPDSELDKLPRTGLSGSGSIEIQLTYLLAEPTSQA